MSTFNTIARRVVVEAGLSEYGITPEFILDSWLKSRYKEILDSVSFGSVNSQFRTRFTAIPVSTGGIVDVTFGSSTVIGTGTAWDASFVNRQFRIPNDPIIKYWFIIADVIDATHLVLESTWPGASNAGLSYEIAQPLYDVATEVKWIIAVMLNQIELPYVAPEALNTMAPLRDAPVGLPTQWSTPSWSVQTGHRFIELYPPPDVAYIVQIVGYVNVLEPTLLTVPINEIDERMLSSGVLADALMYRASRQTALDMASVSMKLADAHEVRYRTLLDNLKRRDAMWVV